MTIYYEGLLVFQLFITTTGFKDVLVFLLITLCTYNLGRGIISLLNFFSFFRNLDHSEKCVRRIWAVIIVILMVVTIGILLLRFIGFYTNFIGKENYVTGYEVLLFILVFLMGMTAEAIAMQRKHFTYLPSYTHRDNFTFFEGSSFFEHFFAMLLALLIWFWLYFEDPEVVF